MTAYVIINKLAGYNRYVSDLCDVYTGNLLQAKLYTSREDAVDDVQPFEIIAEVTFTVQEV